MDRKDHLLGLVVSAVNGLQNSVLAGEQDLALKEIDHIWRLLQAFLPLVDPDAIRAATGMAPEHFRRWVSGMESAKASGRERGSPEPSTKPAA